MKANIILLLVSSLLSLIALEWVVEYWLLNIATPKQLSRYGTFEQIQESRTVMFSRDRYLQYVPAPGYKNRAGSNKHNSLGFRGDEIEVPKPDGVFRIVTVGGSTTYTSAVYDYTKSYPYLMQSLLREQGHSSVEVVNAGVVGYSSWESLINLQFRVLDLEPDIVIVYHALNDVPPRFVYPSTAYRGDNSGSREPYTPRVESFLDLSAAMRIARTELGLRKPLGGLGIARTFEFVPTNYAFQWLTQIRRGDYPSGIFAEQPAEAMVSSNRPVFYERNIRNMVAIAKEHDIEIVLATFAVSPLFKDEPRASSQIFLQAISEHNEVVLNICADHELNCYDFAAEMPTDEFLWSDGTHVTEVGSRKKAGMFSGFLVQRGLLPPK